MKNEKQKTVEERLEVVGQEISRLQKHQEMGEKFRNMIYLTDSKNRIFQNLPKPEGEIMSLLSDYSLHFSLLDYRGGVGFEEEIRMKELRKYTEGLRRDVRHRKMTQETYESIFNGTEPVIGGYLEGAKKDREKIKQRDEEDARMREVEKWKRMKQLNMADKPSGIVQKVYSLFKRS